MLRTLLWLGQLAVVTPALYSSFISLPGLRTPRPTSPGSRTRFRVVVPAHDEASVIAGVASDLRGQAYPDHLAWRTVIADRCSDDTADRARRFVDVVEREEGEGGKGAAIAWYLDQAPLEKDEVLVILDADNRVDTDFLGKLSTVFESGATAAQVYLDVVEPGDAPLVMANALTYWASNRMVQLARSNLGWSCDLGGTGMAILACALEEAGGFTDDLTEDVALNIRLNLAGHRTTWVHDVRVYDEKPADAGSAIGQRARWVTGKRAVRRAYGRTLLAKTVRDRSPALADLAYRLYNPGRSFLALLVGLLAVVSWVAPGVGLWPAGFLTTVALFIVGLPLVFLVVEGVPARYIVRYPYVIVIALLWLPIRIASRSVTSWSRTGHGGSGRTRSPGP